LYLFASWQKEDNAIERKEEGKKKERKKLV
jgi:hypothetical protein